MTPTQCKMARVATKLSTTDLAGMAGISKTTLNNFENGKDYHQSTADKLEKALLSTGKIKFHDNCVCLIEGEN